VIVECPVRGGELDGRSNEIMVGDVFPKWLAIYCNGAAPDSLECSSGRAF
jgi:hypothetical protein